MDENKCKHSWCDLYGGSGLAKNNPEVALVVFFCKHCLEITIRSYSMARFARDPDYDEA